MIAEAMDILPSLTRPQAGALRLIFDDGHIRAIDANGRKYRLRAERGTPVHGVAATGTLTGTTLAAEDSITIAGVEYTLVESDLTGPYAVLVGVSDSVTLDNLIAAINGTGVVGVNVGIDIVAHPSVIASAGAGDTMTLTARVVGKAGNSITTASNIVAGSWGAATLTGGVDATEGSAGDMMVDDSKIYVAVANVSKTSTSGWESAAIS